MKPDLRTWDICKDPYGKLGLGNWEIYRNGIGTKKGPLAQWSEWKDLRKPETLKNNPLISAEVPDLGWTFCSRSVYHQTHRIFRYLHRFLEVMKQHLAFCKASEEMEFFPFSHCRNATSFVYLCKAIDEVSMPGIMAKPPNAQEFCYLYTWSSQELF